METLGRQHAERAQIAALVFAEQPVGIVFHHGDMPLPGDLQDGVHFAAHPGIMHRNYGFGLRCDQGFQPGFVQVKRIWSDVRKDRPCPA